MSQRTLLHGALVWGATAALIAFAVFLRNHQVDDEAAHAPIDIHGAVGQQLTGRNVTATVNSVQITPLVHVDWGDDKPDDYRAHADAKFVVFEVTATTVRSNGMGSADLTVGDKTFGSQYAGFPPSLEELTPGVPTTGRITFEIPDALTGAAAHLRVVGGNDPRLDSRLVVDVDLAKVDRVPSIVLHRKVGE